MTSKRLAQQLSALEALKAGKANETRPPVAESSQSPSIPEARTKGSAQAAVLGAWEGGLKQEIANRDAVIADLKKRLDAGEFNQSEQVVEIDPALVDVEGFNRFRVAFDDALDPDFAELKANIRQAGRNLQPGLIRAVGDRYELIFGERRLQACRQLGIPYRAVVADVSDAEIGFIRESENFARADKCAIERAISVISMTAGNYDSRAEQMAALGISRATFFRYTRIGQVPVDVWSTIGCVRQLSRVDAEMLAGRYIANPAEFIALLATLPKDATRRAVLTLFSDTDKPKDAHPRTTLVRKGSSVSLSATLPDAQVAAALEQLVREFLAAHALEIDPMT